MLTIYANVQCTRVYKKNSNVFIYKNAEEQFRG